MQGGLSRRNSEFYPFTTNRTSCLTPPYAPSYLPLGFGRYETLGDKGLVGAEDVRSVCSNVNGKGVS
jgi:hypothetical protein